MKQKYTFQPDPFGVHYKTIQSVPNGSYVLEIGCASGYLTRELQKRGNTIVGVEINKNDAVQAEKYCTKIIIGDIEDENTRNKIGIKKFDVIILVGILEHLKNPELVLRDMSQRLNPNGIVLLSVPNIVFLTNRLHYFLGRFDYTYTGIMDKTHLQFFTKKTFFQLIKTSGLKIIEFDYSGNFTQLPFYMQTFYPLFKLKKWWRKIEHKLTGFWPQGLAVEFFLICKHP